jgi:hypothetical protein
MNSLNVLIAVIAIGFLACWLSLRRIENFLWQCLLKLIDLSNTADKLKAPAEPLAEPKDHGIRS